jgi:hypothetical protein
VPNYIICAFSIQNWQGHLAAPVEKPHRRRQARKGQDGESRDIDRSPSRLVRASVRNPVMIPNPPAFETAAATLANTFMWSLFECNERCSSDSHSSTNTSLFGSVTLSNSSYEIQPFSSSVAWRQSFAAENSSAFVSCLTVRVAITRAMSTPFELFEGFERPPGCAETFQQRYRSQGLVLVQSRHVSETLGHDGQACLIGHVHRTAGLCGPAVAIQPD